MNLEAAIRWAADAHLGQVYNGGPYILHPLRVMLAVPEQARVAAVLHDVLEDYGFLPPELYDPDRAAVELLTRREADSYDAYIERIRVAPGPAGELARLVKRADLADNVEQAESLTPKLWTRYIKALDILTP